MIGFLRSRAAEAAIRLNLFRRLRDKRGGDTVSLSRPNKRIVHGVLVEKVPIGRYLDLSKRLPNLLLEALDEAFEEKSPLELLQLLEGAAGDGEALKALLNGCVRVFPERLLSVLCEILGADARYVREKLSPAELMRVLQAFWELNDYADFFLLARRAAISIRAARKTGSSAGSSARRKWASESGN